MRFIQYRSALLLTIVLLISTGCASSATQSSTGEYIDDTVITTRVKTAIFNDPGLKSAQINVETYKSVVQLSGFVDSRDDAAKAETLARAVAGVESVRNDIIVK